MSAGDLEAALPGDLEAALAGDLEAALAGARRFAAAHDPAVGLVAGRFLDGLASPAAADAFAAELARQADPTGALPDPLRPGGACNLGSTVEALEMLGALGRLDGPAGEEAARFAMTVQEEDGSWGALESGDAARLDLTALVCGQLARTPFVRHSTLVRAANWLAARWSVELAQEGRYEILTGYLVALSSFPSEGADEALQWCGRELERGFRTGAFGALQVARVFLLCEATALPGSRIDGSELVTRLLAEQSGDGAFEGFGDSPLRATLLGATALRRLTPGA
jgi:hypothetical protein